MPDPVNPASPTAASRTLEPQAREALEDKVGDLLAGLTDDGEAPPAKEPEVEEQEDVEDEGAAATGEDEVDSEEPGEQEEEEEQEETEPGDEAAAADPSKEGDAPTLPDAFRRTLMAYGYTADQIKRDLSKQGLGFIEYAGRMHAMRNQETAQWAATGRSLREQERTQPGSQQQQAPDPFAGLKPVDTKTLKDKYGDDEGLIDEIVGPVNATIAAINAILPQIQQGAKSIQDAETAGVQKQVETFFGGMKGFETLYGGKGVLSNEQLQARNSVLELTDNLITGAAARGTALTLEQALELAHDSVSAKHRESTAQQKVTKVAKARNRGITLRPSAKGGSGGRSPAGGTPTRKDLETRTASRLKAAFS